MYLPVEKKIVLETGDVTKRILLLPHGMGEYDPTDLVGRLYMVVR